MRYQEAYEQVRIALERAGLSFSIGENLFNPYADFIVKNIGLRVVRKKDIETFTSLATKELVFTKANISNQVFKVQFNGKMVPFVDRAIVNEGGTNVDNLILGFFLATDVETGVITAATSADPIQLTSASHGLDSNDYVIPAMIVGLLSATGALSEVNGIRHLITKVDDDNFSIPINGSGYGVVYSSGGVWKENTKKLFWNKTPDAGKTVKVHYYAKPVARSGLTSEIDLPDNLLLALIHRLIGTILNLDGKFQRASSHNGIAKSIEKDHFDVSRTRDPMPYLIPQPLPDFVI